MAAVTENDILSKEEFEDYRARTARYRFMNQLLLGVGGATVFGIVGAVGHSLMAGLMTGQMATSTFTLMGLSATTLAIGAIAALAVVGIGCVYAGSRFLTRNIIIDQDFQAKKISAAARGKSPEIETTPSQPTPPATLPVGAETLAQNEQPRTMVTSAQLEKTYPARALPADLTRADSEQSWVERAAARGDAPAALHA